jgi:hypothetical protein
VSADDYFALKRPCPHCPFREDVPGFLREDRAAGIAYDVLSGLSFDCHKTVDWVEAEGGAARPDTSEARHCAGACIFLEQQDAPNQMMRWYERANGYSRDDLDFDAAPVFDDPEAMIEHHANSGSRRGRRRQASA